MAGTLGHAAQATTAAFSAAFKRGWLFGDGALEWDFGTYGPEVMNGILQAAGLDALTAAMRVLPV